MSKELASESFIDRIKERMTPRFTVILSVSAVLAVLFICMLINIFIGVRTIEVRGNKLAPREEILNVAGISSGSGYFSYNTGKSEKKVIENIHCISDIRISRSVFGKVTVTVSEKNACWYTEVHGEYYALSDELEVIRHSELRDEFIFNDLVRLDFPEVKSVVLGKKIEYADSGRNCEFVPGFLDEIRNTELYKNSRVDQVEMKTKYEIYIVCDMKYKVHIGKSEGTGKKLASVKIMLENSRFSNDDLFEIDASDIGNITARVDVALDFSYLKAVSNS